MDYYKYSLLGISLLITIIILLLRWGHTTKGHPSSFLFDTELSVLTQDSVSCKCRKYFQLSGRHSHQQHNVNDPPLTFLNIVLSVLIETSFWILMTSCELVLVYSVIHFILIGVLGRSQEGGSQRQIHLDTILNQRPLIINPKYVQKLKPQVYMTKSNSLMFTPMANVKF